MSGLDLLRDARVSCFVDHSLLVVVGELCPFVLIVLGQGDWVSFVCLERFPFGSSQFFQVWLGVLLVVL